MKTIQTQSFDPLCYGYIKNSYNQILIDEQKAQTIVFIFEQYLKGDSLAKIVEVLRENGNIILLALDIVEC